MPRYDDAFMDRFLDPWNRHDVEARLLRRSDEPLLPVLWRKPIAVQA